VKRTVLMIVLLCAAVLAFAQTKQTAAPVSAYQISGTVVNAVTGAKLAGAKVVIANAARRNQVSEALTSQAGQFLFDNVAPGKYALAMSAKGFQQQGFEQHEEFSSAIAVGPGKRSTGIVFRAQPEAVLTGQLTGAFSEPVRDGQVYLLREVIENGKQVTAMVQSTNPDDQGVYRFKHLPAGRYHVAVIATPWFAQYGYQGVPSSGELAQADQAAQAETDALLDQAYAVTYFGDTTDPSASSVVVARPGETTVANVNLTPVRATRITLKKDADTAPTHSRSFNVREIGIGGIEMPINVSQVGRNGVMELRGLPPGQYRLDVHDYSEGGVARHTRELDVSGEAQELEDSETAPHGAAVSGKVMLDAGAPAPSDGMVMLQSGRARRGHTARLDAHGEFTFEEPVEPGTYQVFAANIRGAQLRSIKATGAQLSGREITIAPDSQAAQLTIVASRGLGTVNGTALSADAPVAGAMIVLVPQDPVGQGFLMRRDQSDSDGTFTLAQVIPGRYTVLALKNGWEMEWNSPEAIRGYLARGTRVEVDATSKLDVKVEVQ
jgi:hypothetical protein